MLQEIKEKLNSLKETKEFKDFIQNSDKSFLNSIMLDPNPNFNFYNPEIDKFFTFYIDDQVTIEESGVFRKEKKYLFELNIDEIKIDFDQVKDIIKEILFKNKNSEKKSMIILKQEEVPIWGIILITSELNVISLKINALTSNIIEEKVQNILKFRT